jgi:hypothetical protein
MTEDFHITIDVKRTEGGTFVRASIDGVEAADTDATRALVARVVLLLAAFSFGGPPPKEGD